MKSDDTVLECVLHQVGVGFQSQELHYGIFVPGHRPRSDLQFVGYFLHRAPLRQELNDLPLPGSGFGSLFTFLGVSQGDLVQSLGGAGRYVGAAFQYLANGIGQLRRRCLL